MDANRFRIELIHPRYWLTWLGFAIWFLVVQLPYPVLRFLAQVFAYLMLRLAKSRRHVATRNLELCFPGLSKKERAQLLKDNFFSTSMALFESGMAWFWPRFRLQRMFTLEGFEHIEAAEGQGVLLMGMHFTTLDIGGAFYNIHASSDAMYRPHKNLVYDYLQRRGRERHNQQSEMIHRRDVRGLVRALKRGRVVWYAPDQDYGRQQSVFVPFFGVPAATLTATASIARLGKAKVIPFVPIRKPDGSGYALTILPPLENFPSGDEVADTARVNRVIEEQVSRYPEQYLWAHRRFKTRPEGEESVY